MLHSDVLLLSVSNLGHNSYDNSPWIIKLVEYTAKVLAQDRVRIIGVCYGHQIVGRALGVKVGPNEEGWEVAVHDVDLTEQGKQLFGLEKLVLTCSLSACLLPFKHDDQLPANGIEISSVSNKCIVTSSLIIRQIPSPWDPLQTAQCRECTPHAASSVSRDTLNSLRRSSTSFYRLGNIWVCFQNRCTTAGSRRMRMNMTVWWSAGRFSNS